MLATKIAKLHGTKIIGFKPVGHIEIYFISVLVFSLANMASDIHRSEA
jgi:hypothetical protein